MTVHLNANSKKKWFYVSSCSGVYWRGVLVSLLRSISLRFICFFYGATVFLLRSKTTHQTRFSHNLMHINDCAFLRPSAGIMWKFSGKCTQHLYIRRIDCWFWGNRRTELSVRPRKCRNTFEVYHFIFYLLALICGITFLPRSKLWCMRNIFRFGHARRYECGTHFEWEMWTTWISISGIFMCTIHLERIRFGCVVPIAMVWIFHVSIEKYVCNRTHVRLFAGYRVPEKEYECSMREHLICCFILFAQRFALKLFIRPQESN